MSLKRHWNDRSRRPTHPGEILAEAVSSQGLGVTQTARLTGIPRTTLSRLLKGDTNVNADIAVKLGDYFGNSPRFWMNLQTSRDLWDAENRAQSKKTATPRL